MQVGLAMQHLGALLLKLGRTILTLRMGQSPAESYVNAGPAVYISPSGPNPIMVQQAQLDDGKGLAQTVADVKDANKRGAFHFATREGKTEVCKFLVEDLKLNSSGRCFNPGSITNNDKHENKDHNIDKEQVISADSSPLNLEKANSTDNPKVEINQNDENWKKKSLHDEDDAARGDTVGDVCENPRILEMMAKMEKRRERFKEPMTLKRVTEEVAESPWGQVTMKQGNQGAVSLARAIPSSTGFGH
ncbi:hypothetical protein U1Q18_036517 [Sarracenia purpurea var. burkii]